MEAATDPAADAISADAEPVSNPLLGEAPPSEAGPVEPGTPISIPPSLAESALRQTIQFGSRPLPFLTRAARELGEIFRFRVAGREDHFVLSSHPDHAKALFTAKPAIVPSATV